jgi:hypothetical protein
MVIKEGTENKAPNDKPKIKVSKNGPYLISGGIPLVKQIIGTNAEGDSCEWRTGNKY